MIKFFRKIRQDLLSKGKTGKYFKYAIGEIFLVVIGILLALSINNWNSNRIQNNNIKNYYARIKIELNQEIISAVKQKERNEKLISYTKRALRVLNSKTSDSIYVLNDLLGAAATNWLTDYSFPITNEFLNQNYLSTIRNDSLKSDFKLFTQILVSVEEMNNFNKAQYQTSIEPFFAKHINYSNVALKKYKDFLIIGGPKTDFRSLHKNLEFWNVLTFKLESLESESQLFDKTIRTFESLKSKIELELEK